MERMEKTDSQGSPGQKARDALGEKLNRPAKPPPTFPGRKIERKDPPSRKVTDEVDDL